MHYYIYNSDNTGFVAVSETFPTEPSHANVRNIPLENAKLLDGQLYDSRELEYWKLLKTKELDRFMHMALSDGYTVDSIKYATTEASLSKMAQMKINNDENQDKSVGVTIYDYYNDPHSITREAFKKVIKEIGNYMTACEVKYRNALNSLSKSQTITEIQAIVI